MHLCTSEDPLYTVYAVHLVAISQCKIILYLSLLQTAGTAAPL